MRRALKAVRRVLRLVFPPGTGIGLLFFAGLFAWSLLTNEGFSAFGVRDTNLEKMIFGTFMGHILATQGLILAGYLVVGYLLGAFCGAFVGVGARALRRSPGAWTRRLLTLLLLVSLHFVLLGRSIAEYPQLYSEALYDKGGARASIQLWLTDLPLWAFDLFLGLVLLTFAVAAVVAARRAGWIDRIRGGWRRLAVRTRWALAAGVLVAVAAGTTWSLWPVRASAAGPNVIILAVDSLRADRLSAYGYSRPTPAMDRLAKEGALFERAYVSVPRTFPSWTTLLTGMWPYRHGIRHMFPTQHERDAAPPALPKALVAQGYQTSVVADYAGDIFTRMDYGFQRIDAPYFNFPMLVDLRSFEIHKHLLPYVTNRVGRRIYPALEEMAQNSDPRELGARVTAELERLASKGKFFLTVFFSTAHFPYAAPSPYYRLYTDPGYRGRSRYQKLHQLGRDVKLARADIRQIQDLYDGAVRSIDDQMGRILAKVKDLGLERNTYVLVLADHGEHLHDAKLGMGHGEHLRGDQALRIPLIIRGPGIPAGRRVAAPIQDVDLAPTLYARLGAKPAQKLDGHDLMPLLTGGRGRMDRPIFAATGLWFVDDGTEFFQRQRLPYPALTGLGSLDARQEIVIKKRYRDLVLVAKHRMVQTGRYRLIYLPTRDGVKYELYDLKQDPEEHRNVYAQHPRVAQRLKDQLFKWMLGERGVHLRRDYLLPQPRSVASPPVALEGKRVPGG